MSKPESIALYSQKYPSELPWKNRIWTLMPGEKIAYEGNVFEIVRIVRSPVPGEYPTVEVKKVEST